jgi:hypothetical protein
MAFHGLNLFPSWASLGIHQKLLSPPHMRIETEPVPEIFCPAYKIPEGGQNSKPQKF